jgi:hypothetical protein
MKLSAPTQLFFIISLVLFVLGALGFYVVPALLGYAAYLALAAYIVLALGCILKGS